MNSLNTKNEPKCDDDFEDFFCEEEMKVCLVYLKAIEALS